MSNPTGFDLEDLMARLQGGLLALRDVRDRRRQRDTAAAAQETTATAAASARPEPPVATRPEPPGGARIEPQGFVVVEGRLFPVFGDATGFARHEPATATEPSVAPASTPSQAAGEPSPFAPGPSAAPEAARPEPAPRPAALRLPLPKPPPCLGLTPPSEETGPLPQSVSAPSAGADASAAKLLESVLERRAAEEGARLEHVHAEHRAGLAALLEDHRRALQAQAQAHATSTALLVRELLAEHRAELAVAAESHRAHVAALQAEHRTELAALLADRNAAAQEGGQTDVLAAQSQACSDTHEQAARNITSLSDIVADLGQTVGLLAATLFEGYRERTGTAPAESARAPASAAPSAPSMGDTLPPEAVPASPPPRSPVATATLPLSLSLIGRDAAAPPSQPTRPRREPSLDRARLDAFVSEVGEDDEFLDSVSDPDEHRRLAPLTAIESRTESIHV